MKLKRRFLTVVVLATWTATAACSTDDASSADEAIDDFEFGNWVFEGVTEESGDVFDDRVLFTYTEGGDSKLLLSVSCSVGYTSVTLRRIDGGEVRAGLDAVWDSGLPSHYADAYLGIDRSEIALREPSSVPRSVGRSLAGFVEQLRSHLTLSVRVEGVDGYVTDAFELDGIDAVLRRMENAGCAFRGFP